mgnify:CR=1 FL=1
MMKRRFDYMSKKNDNYSQISHKVIDMLIDSTLKRHSVQLDASKITNETKDELRDMLEDLKSQLQKLTNQNG